MKNGQIESFLNQVGVEYAYHEKLELSQVDMAQSRQNQARISQPIVESHLSDIKTALEQENDTGPVILFKNGGGKLVAADGNHRIMGSIDLGWNVYPFGAYIISGATAAQKKVITYSANPRNGLKASEDDRLGHAAFFVENQGLSCLEAARIVGLPQFRVQIYVHDREILRRMRSSGITSPEKIAQTNREALNLIQMENVFVAACEITRDYEIGGETLKILVEKLRSSKSESTALAHIEESRKNAKRIQKENAGQKSAVKKMFTIEAKISNGVSRILAIKTEDIQRIPVERKIAVFDKLNEGIVHLQKLCHVK